ncbi:MAG: copper amine oxidase N-terminal domain-containing protein [Oscillospiraceae bacterium]|nr:copper amine oxidase N-terminal domain-containing protein [Oscillospiraceae bacterium]
MKAKKFLITVLVLAMVASMAITFNFSVQADDESTAVNTSNITPMPMPTVPVQPDYVHIDGTINEITDYIGTDGNPVEGKSIVNIVNGDSEWNAIIDSGTYSITFGPTDKKAMSAGDSIRVFYNANAPATMINPPQLNAEFIALNFPKNESILINRYSDKFMDSKNQLKLNLTDDSIKSGRTEVIYEDGKTFDGTASDLVGRQLVVIYSIVTRGAYAQTTPDKVIVMYEKAVAPIYTLTAEEKVALAKSYDGAAIQINGKDIGAPHAFVTDNGVVMIPLRAIAESAGLTVEWFDDTKTVQVGKSLSFVIGKDQYAFNKMTPVSLGTAPVIKDDKTFVPIDLLTFIGANYSLSTTGSGSVLNIIFDING